MEFNISAHNYVVFKYLARIAQYRCLAMAFVRRMLCLALVALMAIPLPGAFSDWTHVDLTPSTSCWFPPGGGTCSTGLNVSVDGILNSANLSVTGQPMVVDNLLSLNSSALWSGAAGRTNVSLSPDGIGLGGLGSWWEESAADAWNRAPEADRLQWRTVGVNGSVMDNWTLDENGGLRLAKEFEKPYVTDNHTAGLWHFDENGGSFAQDGSGKGNNATLVGGPTWTEGRFGNALRFNGVDQYATATTKSFPVSNTARTLELWARSSDFKQGSACLAGWGGELSTHACAIIIGLNNSKDGSFAFWGLDHDLESKSRLTDNEWHHLAFTYDGPSTLYLDGVPDSSGSLALNTGSGSTFWIANWATWMNEFQGDIDEIRISDIVRTWGSSLNALLLSPVLTVSAHSRVMVQGDFPNGTNYTVDILDPAGNNTTLLKGLKNGDELPLSLWSGLETPYRDIVIRLTVNTSDANITPIISKWGIGTDHLFPSDDFIDMKGVTNAVDNNGLSLGPDSNGTWRVKSSGASPRYLHTAVWDDDDQQMLVFGGYSGSTILNDLWAYSPSSDTWTQKMNGPARQGQVAVWDDQNNQMLVWGGYNTSRMNDLWAYKPSTDSWIQKTSGATARDDATAVWDSRNNQMLVFGGIDGSNWLNDLWAYIPSNDTWVQRASGATQRELQSAIWDSQNLQMLIFGGYNGGATYYSDTYAFKPAGNGWTQKASGATQRSSHSAVWDNMNAVMLVFGGWTGSSSFNDLWAYNPSKDSWAQKANGPTLSYQTAVWDTQRNQMLVFGGRNNSLVKNDLYAYKLDYL